MSGDVQPRKRKDKRKKKDEEEVVPQHPSSPVISDEIIHVHNESILGGNICSKIVFFGLLGALGLMVGLILVEYHGSNDIETQSAVDSPWSKMLEGWLETEVGHDDHEEEHADLHDDHDEHEDSENDQQSKEHESEEHDEGEGEFFSQQTYEDLKAAYNQITLDETDAEPQPKQSVHSESEPEVTESEASEPEASEPEPEASEPEPEASEPDVSEPEASEPEEEEEEEEPSDNHFTERVESIGTESETEEETEDEESEKGGAQSIEDKESQELYDFTEMTNSYDWEIKEELDEAEKDLDENEFRA